VAKGSFVVILCFKHQFNKVVVVDRDDYEQAMYDKRNKQIDELGEEGIDAPTPTI